MGSSGSMDPDVSSLLSPDRTPSPSKPASSHVELDRRILAFFCQTHSSIFAPWLTARRAFHDLIIPFIRADKASLPCMLALTAALMLRAEPNDAIAARASTQFTLAMSTVSQANAGSLQSVATRAMLLCMHATVTYRNDATFQTHWTAVARIINEHYTELPGDHITALLCEFVSFHTLGQTLLSEAERLEPTTTFKSELISHSSSAVPTLHPFFNIMSRIQVLRSRTRKVRRDSNASTDSSASSTAAISTALSIMSTTASPQEVIDKTVEAIRLDASLRSVALPEQPPELRKVVEVWKAACWVQLARAMSPAGRSSTLLPRIDSALSLMTQSLQEDPCWSGLLLLPLFLIGCSTFDKSKQYEVLASYDHIYQWRPWDCIVNGRTVVTTVWKRFDNADTEPNWQWETASAAINNNLPLI